MNKWIETLKKTGEAITNKSGFFWQSIIIIVVLYLVAFGLERIIIKKNGKEERSKTRRLAQISVFSALAFVLMLYEVPLWFVPSFYKLDASEIPIMIGTFVMGPTAGVIMEAVKIFLKILFKGTGTLFVGDFANFVIGCMFVVPAGFIYHLKKTQKRAVIGMVVGTLFMATMGCLLNKYILLPFYMNVFHMSEDVLVAAGTKANSAITSLGKFVIYGVLPFNLIKGVFISIVTALLYKRVRKVVK